MQRHRNSGNFTNVQSTSQMFSELRSLGTFTGNSVDSTEPAGISQRIKDFHRSSGNYANHEYFQKCSFKEFRKVQGNSQKFRNIRSSSETFTEVPGTSQEFEVRRKN